LAATPINEAHWEEPDVIYADKTLTCRECGADFTFTAGEQEFYAAKGLLNEPARCPDCRAVRRSRAAAGGMEMGSRREMHPAVCASCGVETMVPFLPRGDRPVYCSTCFDRVRAAGV
jgi:CxxC-x17-CxxC domain-containing protein